VTRRVLRALAVTLLCGFGLLLGTAPAFAHTRLEGSDPADGASLSTAPQKVTLTFNEAVPAEFTTLTVIGPGGTAYQTGPVTATNGAVSTAVLPLGPAGRYEIGYRVVSDDGHPVSGSLAFTMTTGTAPSSAPSTTTAAVPTPAAAAPATAAPVAAQAPAGPAGGDGAPVWPWIVGAVVLVGAGVAAALRLGRG
jgi:copper resistance protein C